MFLTDARELGAREVAPDALLVKLPKKKRKIKKSNKSEENPENRKKVLVDPGRHFPVPYRHAHTALPNLVFILFTPKYRIYF